MVLNMLIGNWEGISVVFLLFSVRSKMNEGISMSSKQDSFKLIISDYLSKKLKKTFEVKRNHDWIFVDKTLAKLFKAFLVHI